MPLEFSTPGGRDGWEGKGRTKGWMMAEKEERRGSRKVRFFGVVRMVMVMAVSVEASLWVRSKRGIMWPCDGNGTTRMWGGGGLLPFGPFMVELRPEGCFPTW